MRKLANLDSVNVGYYDFGKLEKAKYTLVIDRMTTYFFVTTIRPEDYCVEVLKNMALNGSKKKTRNYIIKKTVNGVTTVLYKGTVKEQI